MKLIFESSCHRKSHFQKKKQSMIVCNYPDKFVSFSSFASCSFDMRICSCATLVASTSAYCPIWECCELPWLEKADRLDLQTSSPYEVIDVCRIILMRETSLFIRWDAVSVYVGENFWVCLVTSSQFRIS